MSPPIASLRGPPASVASDQVYRIVDPILALFSKSALTFLSSLLGYISLDVRVFVFFSVSVPRGFEILVVLLKVHWSIFDPSLSKKKNLIIIKKKKKDTSCSIAL